MFHVPNLVCFPVLRSCQGIHRDLWPCVLFHNNLEVFQWGVVCPCPTPKLEGHPYRLSYVCSYPPYLEAISPICNLRISHAMLTGEPLNMTILQTNLPKPSDQSSIPWHVDWNEEYSIKV
jgi:hypothetical protein